MKRICSLLLSVAIFATMVFCPTAGILASATASAVKPNGVMIENTFDEEGWNPLANSNLIKEEITDGSNGNALRFNYITSVTAATGNDIRHYKIYNPQDVYGGYVTYKPAADTMYKLTFRYRTRSLLSNNIFINVRDVANGTVGDVLCRAVTVKKSLKLTTNDDYKWDTAVAYFKTPANAEGLAIAVEYDNATNNTNGAFNVAIDDVKLEVAPDNFVLANTFEEDDVTVDTINLGSDTTVYKNSSIDVSQGVYSHTTTNASTLRTNSTLAFRAARIASHKNKVHYEIYDYSQSLDDLGKLRSFVPENGSNYRITFDYKMAASTSTATNKFTIRPVTVDESGNRTLGDVIATAVNIPAKDANHPSPSIWQTAAVNVSVAEDIDGLALTIEASANVGTYTTIDNIVVHKYDSNVIINDYEETMLGIGKNATTMANTKITGANLFHLGTKSGATPNTSRILQFERITGQTAIAEGNYTYAEIYNPYDADFAGFTPKADTYYKLSFDYKVKRHSSGTISFNVRGKTAEGLGDVIATATTVASNDAYFADYAWNYASVLINTAGKDYDTLAISIETSATGNAGLYPYLDNIKLEEVTNPDGETTITVHHDGEIYHKSKDVLTKKNSDLLSDITFENTETAEFKGLYFDSAYTIPVTGVVYGETDVYAKWKDLGKFVNSYDASGVSLEKLVGEGITFWGKRTTELAPNSTNVIQFNNVYGQNYINDGKIIHVEIYNPNDENFATGDKLPSFNPSKNSVYKINFEFRVKASANSNISFNIRGIKDGGFSDVLGTAVVLESGDPNYSSYVWDEAEVYVYTDDVDYDALALTIESDGKNNANLWPYIDNINVECVKEYKNGIIDTIAPAANNKSGLAAIKDGKWFEVAQNDYAKVSFKLNTATAIANSYVGAKVVNDNGLIKDVTLFDFSADSGERFYSATFKAPTTGKVVISVYKNDDTVVNQEVVLSDITIDTHTPSVKKGDANLDGEINIVDLIVLKKASSLNYAVAGDYLVNSDLDKDGEIKAGDVVINRKQLLGAFEKSEDIGVNVNYAFANETAGSAEGTITLTSTKATDNFVEIYWGANGEPLDNYYFIGSAEVKAGQSVDIAMASHLAIPEGATQIIVNDGLASKAFDIAKRYDASFVPDKIGLVKDYTVNDKQANVKFVCDSDLSGESYDLICEFRNELSDVLGADVELIDDSSDLNANQNYIVVGNTRFSESATLLNSITTARDDYHGDFAIKATGRQIYINASNDYALQFAFDRFFNTYCANGVTAIENDINYLSSKVLKTITLADRNINEYRIVYPETATVLEVDAAEYLAANIVKATGKAPMSIVNDSTAAAGYEILIGHTNRTDDTYATTADTAADNSYTITVEADRTIITGGTNSAVNAAVIDFVDRLLTGSLAVGTYDGKYDGSFSLTNGFKLTWSDEFNGTALSNTWQLLDLNYETKAGGKVVWNNDNAIVENGALKATVSKVADSNDVTGVSLDTAHNKLVRYGYFEARIKSFDQLGYMNGFWGSTIGGEADYIDGKPGTYYGEFDILERYELPSVIRPNLHNHCVGEATSKNYLQGENSEKPYTIVDDIGTKYHNFAMEWTDDYIYFYLDGVKYYSFDCSTLSEYEVFDMVTRIRLTFSAGKYITPTADSDEAFVDWIRVWQKDEVGYVMK